MSYDFKAVRVLIVDDSQHLHEIYKVLLGAMQIKNVIAVRNPDEGLGRLALSAPDFVITDVSLGAHDGMAFVRRVRNGERGVDPYVPIIVVTGHTETDLVKQARDTGVNEVLARPVSVEALYYRIVSLIERPRPFVQTATFFGPDRRRQEKPFEGPEKRENVQKLGTAIAGQGLGTKYGR